jgi:hypothetical protein
MSDLAFDFENLPPAENESVRITALIELQSGSDLVLEHVEAPDGGVGEVVVDGGDVSLFNRDM